MEIRTSREGKRSPERLRVRLAEIGAHLRRAYFAATTPEPLRTRARRDPQGEEGQRCAAALRLVQPTEPLMVVVLAPEKGEQPDRQPGVQIGVTTIRTAAASFRTLVLQRAEEDISLARLARRTFVRLNCQAMAIRRLANAWKDEPDGSAPSPDRLDALGRLADALHDSSRAIVDTADNPLPLLGEAAEPVTMAARELAFALETRSPSAAQRHLRLAKRLIDNAASPVTLNMAFDSTVGVQGQMLGGTVVQNPSAA